MIILGCPVYEQYELTQKAFKSLVETVTDPENFHFVLIDNHSDTPYRKKDFQAPFKVSIIREDENIGYYYPLKQITDRFVTDPQKDLVGLVHNDVFFYEKGWDKRMQQSFDEILRVGLIGLVGSYEIDGNGGRGGGTMCFFNGSQGQPQSAGQRVTNLRPAVVLDSLFMLFRATVVPHLNIDEHIAPCHFYDRIWSCRTIEAGWSVAVLGVEIDHMGGQTSIGVGKYQADALRWCAREGVATDGINGDLGVYKEAERRFLTEYRDTKRLIPLSVDPDWTIRRFR